MILGIGLDQFMQMVFDSVDCDKCDSFDTCKLPFKGSKDSSNETLEPIGNDEFFEQFREQWR